MSLFMELIRAHVDVKRKDNLILGKRSTQGLDDTTLTAEVKFSINFTQSGKRSVLGLYYDASNSLLFVQKYINSTYHY